MSTASDLSRRLARNAEAVCRHYLPAGRGEGRYWIVGDAMGSAGRSLYVRLKGPDHGRGAAGKWTDAATGAHGDLLDLLALNCGHCRLADTLDEARRFLALPGNEVHENVDNAPVFIGSLRTSPSTAGLTETRADRQLTAQEPLDRFQHKLPVGNARHLRRSLASVSLPQA